MKLHFSSDTGYADKSLSLLFRKLRKSYISQHGIYCNDVFIGNYRYIKAKDLWYFTWIPNGRKIVGKMRDS